MKDRQAQPYKGNTKFYPGKPSWGRKPSKKFLCIRCIKDKIKDPKIGVPLSSRYLSLSLSMHYAQVSIRVSNEEHLPLFIFFRSLDILLNYVGPTVLDWVDFSRETLVPHNCGDFAPLINKEG